MSLQQTRRAMMRQLPGAKGSPVKSSAAPSRTMPSSSSKSDFRQPSGSSIEFQLSKKTAELTMIVQMLFSQLHTKETECDLWQRYYNEFGETVLNELANEKTAIATLRASIGEMQKLLLKSNEESQLQQKDIAKMKQECASASERCQQYSTLYNETVNQKNSLSAEVDKWKARFDTQKEMSTNLQGEVDRLSELVKSSEKRERMAQARLEGQMTALQKDNQSLNAELNQLKGLNDDMSALRYKAEEDRRILSMTLDSLRADYQHLKEKHEAARSAPFVNPQLQLMKEEEERRQRILSARKNLRSAGIGCNLLENEQSSMENELVTLRRELQRYKLELKNRDASFNRMFAAATNRPAKNGNLMPEEEDEEGSSSFGMKALVTHGSPPVDKRNTASRRIPLVPAQFQSSQPNSMARRQKFPPF